MGQNGDFRGHEHSQCGIQILIASNQVVLKKPYQAWVGSTYVHILRNKYFWF